ncbi:ankyrin repeat-containing domain protein [Nemania sp. FL0031]|nr:ankyrin repeat-containing domain protein [Nemania sp. FL0031]
MLLPPPHYCQKILYWDHELAEELLEEFGVEARLSSPGDPTWLQAIVSRPIWDSTDTVSEEVIIRTIDFLLSKNADINAPANHPVGRTALQAACENGTLKIIQHLLDNGADINAPPAGQDRRTALQAAAGRTDEPLNIIHHLLDWGAHVNAPPARNGGRTALQAASGTNLEVVECLLDNEADVFAPVAKYDGRNPFQAAADQLRIDIIYKLADPHPPPNMSLKFPITINGNTLNKTSKVIESGTFHVTQRRYALVQTKKPTTSKEHKEVEDWLRIIGLDKLEYVSDNTHIYSYHIDGRRYILARIRADKRIAYADLYKQLFKVQPVLKSSMQTTPDADSSANIGTPCAVDVVFHKDVHGEKERLPEIFKQAVARQARVSTDRVTSSTLKVSLVAEARYLADIAKISEVKYIQQHQ